MSELLSGQGFRQGCGHHGNAPRGVFAFDILISLCAIVVTVDAASCLVSAIGGCLEGEFSVTEWV